MFYFYYRKKSIKLQIWLFILSLLIDFSISFLGRVRYAFFWQYSHMYMMIIITITNIISNFFYTLDAVAYFINLIICMLPICLCTLYCTKYCSLMTLVLLVLSHISKQFLHYIITTNPKKINFIGSSIEYIDYKQSMIYKPYKTFHVNSDSLNRHNNLHHTYVFAQTAYLVEIIKNSLSNKNKQNALQFSEKKIYCLDGDPLYKTIDQNIIDNRALIKKGNLIKESIFIVDHVVLLTNSADFASSFVTKYHDKFSNIFIVTDDHRSMLLNNLNQYPHVHKVYLQGINTEKNIIKLMHLILERLNISTANAHTQDHKLSFIDGYFINKYNFQNYLNIYQMMYKTLPKLTKVITLTQTSIVYTNYVFNLLKTLLYFCDHHYGDNIITLNVGELKTQIDLRSWQDAELYPRVNFIDTDILSHCVAHLLTKKCQSLKHTHTALLGDKHIDTRVLVELAGISHKNICIDSDLIIKDQEVKFNLIRNITDNATIKEIEFDTYKINTSDMMAFIGEQIYQQDSKSIEKNIAEFLKAQKNLNLNI